MIVRHKKIEVDKKSPFSNCKLDREKYASVLTDIVRSYADGFVLAINNKWGTGKTTFLEMWHQHLEIEGFKTCYFNAWEHDFDKNPMVAILSELKSVAKTDNTKAFDSVVKKGAVILKAVLPAIVKGLAKKYVDKETIETALEKGTEGMTDILKGEIDDYVAKKNGLIEFRTALQNFVKESSGGKPLIIIIDELDRCRPDYAVEVLEQVKHFFSVEGIVFVLAIDKIQLAHAICGFYGSDKIDTGEYLRRFIDIEYSLPAPLTKDFCRYLFEYFEFKDFFLTTGRLNYAELKTDHDIFIESAAMLFDYHGLTLRQQEKIFAHARIVLRALAENNYCFPALLIILLYIRSANKQFYDQIKSLELDMQSALDAFQAFLPQEVDPFNTVNFRGVEAQFILFYNNSYRQKYPSIWLIEKGDSGEPQLRIRSSFTDARSNDRLLQFINDYMFRYSDIKITFLLNKIDLIEPLVS